MGGLVLIGVLYLLVAGLTFWLAIAMAPTPRGQVTPRAIVRQAAWMGLVWPWVLLRRLWRR